MKYLITVIFILLVSITVNAQVQIVDTLQGNETVNFTSIRGASQIQALCTQLGGTSDGTLILKASVDGVTFVTVNEKEQMFVCFPNDTLTITNGAGWLIDIKGNPFKYYKIVGAGTASDTTKISIDWSK